MCLSVALPAAGGVDLVEVRTCVATTLELFVAGIMKSRTAAEQDGVQAGRQGRLAVPARTPVRQPVPTFGSGASKSRERVKSKTGASVVDTLALG